MTPSSTRDLVVADYAVPGFNGMAALRLVKAKDIDVPFIIVSGTIGRNAPWLKIASTWRTMRQW